MKKNVKVFSASDFSNATTGIVVDTCFWVIDDVSFTEVGSYSKTPLFELQLKRFIEPSKDTPTGLTDMSSKMTPNRTYIVREGRPLYNELVPIWEDCDLDTEVFRSAVRNKYKDGGFRGRVERLCGVSYQYSTKRGTVIQRNRAEFWYPDEYESSILDDFIYLCNKGVYIPIIQETPAVDPVAEALKGLDPKIIAAIKAMK